MSARPPRPKGLLAFGAALLLAPLTMGGLSSASAAPLKPTKPLDAPALSGKLASTKVKGKLLKTSPERRAVFVQLTGAGAADVASSTLQKANGGSEAAARTAARDRRLTVRRTADTVAAAARRTDSGATTLYSVSNAVPGVALVTNDEAIEALAQRPDVVSISALVPKKATNASTAQLTKAVNSWKSPGVTGKGVKVGIIDTGIDYTHADFGGPGTVAAYQAALANKGAFTPTRKVVGGYDFVGDAYDGDVNNEFKPDANPIDCNEHGTHVAGTAAGYGVNANGSTFTGSYAGLTGSKLYDMRIGPGMAPDASLYALRVFGCTGSTNAVIPALDWALDPNGDGDFDDHLDIVNLSLGADSIPADDPENAVMDVLAKNGVLPVVASGNAGDLTDVGGEPGNSVRALTVASSVDELQLRDGLRVTAPAALAGIAAGQMSVAYDWAGQAPVSGSVVALSAANDDGCEALSDADRAKVAGKVAWLEWDDNDATRQCGSVARANNLAAAGAVGSIFTSGLDVFGAGISGNASIPVMQLPKAETDRLRPAVTAGTLAVTFDGTLRGTIKSVTPAISDTLSSFSSRGTHSAPGVVKPDVTAPGDTITSAGMGTGNDQLTISGTSMATPATAGIAALVLKRHPTWTSNYVKAAVMNTATHDLYTKANHQGEVYGPNRVGAGRVDALAAVSTKVIAYSLDKAGAVSASFGAVEAPIDQAKVTRTRTIRIRNTGSATTTVKVAYQSVIKQPGVSYSASRSKVTLRAGRSVDVKVTMTVVPAQLRHTIDPTMAKTQSDAYLVDEDDKPITRARQYVSDASGRLLVTPAGKSALRVPVYGAAKPASVTRVSDTTFAGSPALKVTGKGFDQGSGSTAFQSKLSVTTLGYNSPRQPVCQDVKSTDCTTNASSRAGDIHYVGAGAVPAANGSKAEGMLWFGVTTYENTTQLGTYNSPYVDIDTTGDGKPDFEAYVQKEPESDLFNSLLIDYQTGELVDVQPVNFLDGDDETNIFDTNALLIPVLPAAMGMTEEDTSFPISYSVATDNLYAPALAGYTQDSTPAVAFDVADPGIRVAGRLYPDVAGTTIPYSVSPTAATTPRALVIHLHGQSGSKAEAQTLAGATG